MGLALSGAMFTLVGFLAVVEITGEVYRSLNVEAEIPRTIQKADLANYHAPTLVLGAEQDVLLPGNAVIQRAQEVIPNLVAAELIAGNTHFIPERLWLSLCERVDRFIQTSQ